MRKVCVVVTARPSYSRIKTALRALQAHPDTELQLVIAASALLDRYGTAVDFIERDGFTAAAKVHMVLEGGHHGGERVVVRDAERTAYVLAVHHLLDQPHDQRHERRGVGVAGDLAQPAEGVGRSVAELARQRGFEYRVRSNRGHLKKAGNLKSGYDQSDGDLIAKPIDWDVAENGPAPRILVHVPKLHRPGHPVPGVGGFVYHTQDLAFHDWFYRTPSTSTGSKYSFVGNFTNVQGVCS